ncbi:MAG: precorrin-6y C5,15-methyltransferase (decarboxylating) subunit CbiE [Alphaproteobacteria bacterium]|nr:precorrin-6y C5,15-methyltransferase (decarboxylating) subunit CbiE [Alphaproteobacteria bacterium]
MTPWLAIVGLGDDGLDGLTPSARALIADAELLVGGERHLNLIPNGKAARMRWTSPLSGTVDAIDQHRGRRVVVLASGDPMFYGIGVTLTRRFAPADLTIIPAPGAFGLACARLGWAEAEVETLTLHGRPLDLLNLHCQPGLRLVVLSENGDTPAAIAQHLAALGFGPSRITVLEHLGGPVERIYDGTADNWPHGRAADLNTVAIDMRAGPTARISSRVPGLADDVFRHDGQITKREVRAATLAALQPMTGQRLWDVGAGCGSVAIEWLRAARGASAHAIESEANRRALIAANAASLGVPMLAMVTGQAPSALAGLPAPDAIFVGGGLATPGLFEACWPALKSGGRLVANAVTLDGESQLAAWRERCGGRLVRIAVQRAEPIGSKLGWRALAPVTQLIAVKA